MSSSARRDVRLRRPALRTAVRLTRDMVGFRRKHSTSHGWRAPLCCAVIAVATAGAAALATISIANWNVTVLVRMAAEEPLAPLARDADPDFAFVHFHGRGDGVSYYAIARDPLALGAEHDLFVWPAYRYGHPGFSWLAWALSFGNATLIPYVFLLLNLFGMGVAAGAASLVARELGYSPWGGLLVALNPGLVYATTIDTSEPVAAALLVIVLLLWIRGRWRLALPVIAALCFMKEWFVLVPVGLALWELAKIVRTQRRDLWRRIAALALSIGPFAVWYGYVILRFREWPAAPTRDFLQLPPTGWAQTARTAAAMGTETFDKLVSGHATVPLLAVVAAALAFGTIRALRIRTPVDPVFLMFMPIVFAMNKWGLLYVKDLMREVAIPLVLLPAAAAGYGTSVRQRLLTGRRERVAAQEASLGPRPDGMASPTDEGEHSTAEISDIDSTSPP